MGGNSTGDAGPTYEQRERMIVEQYGGIDPPYEAFYIQSIIYAAERSELAFDAFEHAAQNSMPAEMVFAVVQEALTHAAALSRFFWPVSKTGIAAARGNRLREAFELNEGSPLRSRKLRNAFEHFDEHLDRFLLGNRAGYFFPGPLVDDHSLADEDIGYIFKLVDPSNGICVLLGEKFEYLLIRRDVQRGLGKALEMDGAGSRLR